MCEAYITPGIRTPSTEPVPILEPEKPAKNFYKKLMKNEHLLVTSDEMLRFGAIEDKIDFLKRN